MQYVLCALCGWGSFRGQRCTHKTLVQVWRQLLFSSCRFEYMMYLQRCQRKSLVLLLLMRRRKISSEGGSSLESFPSSVSCTCTFTASRSASLWQGSNLTDQIDQQTFDWTCRGVIREPKLNLEHESATCSTLQCTQLRLFYDLSTLTHECVLKWITASTASYVRTAWHCYAKVSSRHSIVMGRGRAGGWRSYYMNGESPH